MTCSASLATKSPPLRLRAAHSAWRATSALPRTWRERSETQSKKRGTPLRVLANLLQNLGYRSLANDAFVLATKFNDAEIARVAGLASFCFRAAHGDWPDPAVLHLPEKPPALGVSGRWSFGRSGMQRQTVTELGCLSSESGQCTRLLLGFIFFGLHRFMT